MCGLVALLSAQFRDEDFSRTNLRSWSFSREDSFETAIGGFFLVAYPIDWPAEERYSFDWQVLKLEAEPFQNFNFG